MSALRSAPSDKKASRVQKCSLNRVWLSGKRVKGDAKGSCCRADLFLGPLVCKAVGRGESNNIKAKETQSVHPILIIYLKVEGRTMHGPVS